MKRALYFVLFVVVLVGIYFAYRHRQSLGFGSSAATATAADSAATPAAQPAPITWRTLDRAADGFRIDLPTDVKQVQIPAYNEHGGAENVDMLYAYPDPNTSYSITWEDNPPVERVNSHVPERTLDMAMANAADRAQTVLVDQADISQQGFPGRQFSSRNANGGVMNARLVLARGRLYMLTAAFPSAAARRQQDVARFFDSFSVVVPGNR